MELYNHNLARRRRLCRALAWLLAVFLLLDIGVVLYIGLRMRHAEEPEQPATVTCRLRFRSATANENPVERTELITASTRRVLMQPVWAADGHPTVLIDMERGFTLLRSPAFRMCFIRPASWSPKWTRLVAQWAREPHDVRPEQTRYVHLVVKQPAISLESLIFYGKVAWNMCNRYETYLVEPMLVLKPRSECPMFKCIPCPSGLYLRDKNGCQTCLCAKTTTEQPAYTRRRRRNAVVATRLQFKLDEGVLPEENGSLVHTIDLIEF